MYNFAKAIRPAICLKPPATLTGIINFALKDFGTHTNNKP
jgi:hypothetical protein